MKPPQRVMMPAIDPFTIKNRQLSNKEIDGRLAHYRIPTDLPLVVQISRFDPWKDPKGVVEAFKLASKEADARLVLLAISRRMIPRVKKFSTHSAPAATSAFSF